MSYPGADNAEPSGYSFADLGGLDGVIGGWREQRDEIEQDGTLLAHAVHGLRPSAHDVVTAGYFVALGATFGVFHHHNNEMARYTTDYARNLAASRLQMSVTEDGVRAAFSREGDG
ncbi:hypothetical protein [Actinophytocola sp.]|uniref:hypothetical protein n=1 Tax=Actinophytocola sp. TaxID=1872138 RepID=UPI002D5FF1C7|nr:hypothetical protein [Actinophytocola sp.]HYQ62065.1 hypothetical protein [Actinophytocola sp.]